MLGVVSKKWVDFNNILPFQLKMSNLLPQLCEDLLLTGHSKEGNNKQNQIQWFYPTCFFFQYHKAIRWNRLENWNVSVWRQIVHKRPHQVAFKTDKVDPHWDGSVGVAAQSFDPLHQVSAELVASLQDAQHHDVTVPQIIHDVSGQTLCPVRARQVAHVQSQAGRPSCL